MKVESIEVVKEPDVTSYEIGDTFSAEGGIIKVNYDDGSSEEISMTDDRVSLSSPTMNSANTKNVTVTYEGERTTFQILVTAAQCDVRFNLNYGGAPEAETVKVPAGNTVERPEDPTRDGYTFVNWYADADFTRQYDFSTEISGETDIYALWSRNGATYVDVTFDYDYYGAKFTSYSYPVEQGTPVSRPTVDPIRVGYSFEKWVDESGADFNFEQPITTDTTIKASWTKSTSGTNTYVFEAEDTDLTGKIGPSYSGTAQETSMILYNDGINASGNRLVGYLYERGLGLEFCIASDMAVNDATLTVRITGEYTTMTYDSNEFQVIVNGVPLSYPRVTIPVEGMYDIPACEDLIVIQNVSLQEGSNEIKLLTNNSNAITGTTFKANAPMVDCLKIDTEAVLIWDENYGVPAPNYQK